MEDMQKEWEDNFKRDISSISQDLANSESKDDTLKHMERLFLNRGGLAPGDEMHLYFILSCQFFEELIIQEKMVDIVEQKPDLFGTGRTVDVLTGLWPFLGPKLDFDTFVQKFSKEQFAYIGEYDINGVRREKFLRLDLYRLDHGDEFTGGLFHAFKHFNIRGNAMTTQTGENDIRWINHFMAALLRAFLCSDFVQDSNPDRAKDYLSIIDFCGHSYRFVFYYNDEAKVYFLKTAYVED